MDGFSHTVRLSDEHTAKPFFHESRTHRTLNPDVDCSSFVYYALLKNGYTKAQLGSEPFTTSTMGEYLEKAGFSQRPYTSAEGLKIGDILVNAGSHTEVYIGNGKTVGAHSNYNSPEEGDQSGREISAVTLASKWKPGVTKVYRK